MSGSKTLIHLSTNNLDFRLFSHVEQDVAVIGTQVQR